MCTIAEARKSYCAGVVCFQKFSYLTCQRPHDHAWKRCKQGDQWSGKGAARRKANEGKRAAKLAHPRRPDNSGTAASLSSTQGSRCRHHRPQTGTVVISTTEGQPVSPVMYSNRFTSPILGPCFLASFWYSTFLVWAAHWSGPHRKLWQRRYVESTSCVE
jgi:hypothetical protein